MHCAVQLLAFVQNNDTFRGKFINWSAATPYLYAINRGEMRVTYKTRVKTTAIFSKGLSSKNGSG